MGKIDKPRPELKTAKQIISHSYQRALGGGLPGAAAMVVQVSTLMWLRTTMNFQYRHGMTSAQAIKHLYQDGGIRRFYKGAVPALLQGPLSRFGDTFANAGMIAFLSALPQTANLPMAVKTISASLGAGAFRIILMPIDTVKTIMQVEGRNGMPALWNKVRASGPSVFFHGSLASAAATAIGHYPWFVTFNVMDEKLPRGKTLLQKLSRNAVIGLSSSVISDVVSNSTRVLKTYRQSSTVAISYPNALRDILATDGISGLMFRGLKTRVVAHGINGIVFTVMWKWMEDNYLKRKRIRE